jgi:RNA polymerase sigma-70 factor (ECF subfamily)
MMQAAPSTGLERGAKTGWDAALRGDRDAFEALVAPCAAELFEAARRELRYHVALGDLRPDDLTPEELVGDVLVRAWRDRHRRPPRLGMRAWLLALLFRVLKDFIRQEARFRRLADISLEQRPPQEPLYDDESFWEWHQPDEFTRWEDLVDKPSVTPEEFAAADEEFTRGLDPRSREVFLLSEVHRLDLLEIALALGISLMEVARLLEEARRRVGLPADDKVL